MNATKFCIKCGGSLKETDEFCANCGATMEETPVKAEETAAKAEETAQQEVVATPSSIYNPPTQDEKNKLILWMVLSIIIPTDMHGTPVSIHQCETCGRWVTLCPAVKQRDPAWQNCLALNCDSYDVTRDVDLTWEIEPWKISRETPK